MKVDVRLYALIDPERAAGRPLPELAAMLAGNGATLIQLRDKMSGTRAMIAQARAIRAALARFSVPLVINDRVDVALAAGAEGVHVGQDDMSVEDARRLMGPDAIIGLSVKTIAQAEAALVDHLSYVCIGGVYATQSKDNPDPPIGNAGFRAIAAIIRERKPSMPVGAIAGIDETNAQAIMDAGADGIAVISALSQANDPAAAARNLRAIVDRALMRGQE